MKVIITGASGGLGHYVCQATAQLGWTTLTPPHTELDLTSFPSINAYLLQTRADVILHLAGLANVDRCEREPQAAVDLNTLGTLRLLQRTRTRILLMSTNDVFSGLIDAGIGGPYDEDTIPAPLNTYTWSKYAAEQAVLAAEGIVVRANFFTRRCRAKESFAAYVLRNAREGVPFNCYTNVVACPVFAGTLAKIICDLATAPSRVFHVATTDAVDRLEQAQLICRAYGLDDSLARGVRLEDRAGKPLDARLKPSADIELLSVREEVDKLRAEEPL